MSRFHDFETGVATQRRNRTTVGAQAPDLFDAPVLATPTAEIRGMVRGTDAIESQRAAVSQVKGLTHKQALVLALLERHGALTDHELEHLPEALVLLPTGRRMYAETTLSKRRCELVQLGKVRHVGRRDRKSTWGLV